MACSFYTFHGLLDGKAGKICSIHSLSIYIHASVRIFYGQMILRVYFVFHLAEIYKAHTNIFCYEKKSSLL